MKIAGLEKAIKLDHKISLYVPGTNGVNTVADNAKTVSDAVTYFSVLFGGASAYGVNGYWVSDSGELVKENTIIVYSFCTKRQLEQFAPGVVAMAERIKAELKQEAVSVEVDGTLYLV